MKIVVVQKPTDAGSCSFFVNGECRVDGGTCYMICSIDCPYLIDISEITIDK